MPFGEIVANPSDLKHVGELMGRSNGLGVVITSGLHHLCVFYKRFPNGAKWYETEVGSQKGCLQIQNFKRTIIILSIIS